MSALPADLPQPVTRNAPCPCGSGQRYKSCHGRLDGASDGIAPALREAGRHNDRGTQLQAQRRFEEALQSFDTALALMPDHPGILRNRGNALMDLRRHEEAMRCFARLVELAPDHPWALGSLYQAKMLCCDWTSIASLAERIDAAVRSDKPVVVPLVHIAMSASPADQLRAARIEAALYERAPLPMPPHALRYGHRTIRLAYVSADFRQHPVAQLAAHLFESHDRARFEVTAISFGPDNADALRRRLEHGFDHFLDVRQRSDAEIATLMREREIDIAVDLMGYTNSARPGILACRAAPVQVNYLGYPGTMGGSWIDYILADPHVIPTGEEPHYAERVVRLPDTYFVHDPAQRIGDAPGRSEAGLPEGAFVFCCFNNTYKIMPATFDRWMRILAAVDGAVLWLLAPSAVAQRNLRAEAERRGIAADRLIFAARVPPDVHLARHCHADLFLDTHHYNAHTTAVDALWAGLPVLTYRESTMAGRVATALVHAMGLPELAARDPAEYESRAIELARTPELLRALRAKLAKNRATQPLFDPERYRIAIEKAYTTMWERSEAGLPAVSFDVQASASGIAPT